MNWLTERTMWRGRWNPTVFAVVVQSILVLIGIFVPVLYGIFLLGRLQRTRYEQLDRQKQAALEQAALQHRTSLALEEQQAQNALIVELTSTSDTATSHRNLTFFLDARLLNDSSGAIRRALQTSVPVIVTKYTPITLDLKVNGTDGPLPVDGQPIRYTWKSSGATSCGMMSPVTAAVGLEGRSELITPGNPLYPRVRAPSVFLLVCRNETSTAVDYVVATRQ